MSDTEKRARQWAKRHIDFRYLVDSDLIGWLWPWQHRQLVERLQNSRPAKFEALKDCILAPESIRPIERHHPDYIAATSVTGLLV